MKGLKSSYLLFVLCFVVLALIFPTFGLAQVSILKSHGGRIIPNPLINCSGEPSFSIKTPFGNIEGLFGIIPTTQRFSYWTIWGIPGRHILLLASPIKAPICVEPCPTGLCPVLAYPVIMFGTSLIP